MNICCDNIYCLWPIILIMKIRKLVESKAAFSKNLSTRCVFVLVLYLFCNCIERKLPDYGWNWAIYEIIWKTPKSAFGPNFLKTISWEPSLLLTNGKKQQFCRYCHFKIFQSCFWPPSRLNTWQNLSILSKSVVFNVIRTDRDWGFFFL